MNAVIKSNVRHVRMRGFTLTELMIALTILGILMSIAVPSYMSSVRKSNRADAHGSLTRTATNLERFFAANSTYTTDVVALGFPADGLTEHDYYTISVVAGDSGTIASSYLIKATAVATAMQNNDTGCTVLSLDHRGTKVPDPGASTCW